MRTLDGDRGVQEKRIYDTCERSERQILFVFRETVTIGMGMAAMAFCSRGDSVGSDPNVIQGKVRIYSQEVGSGGQ